MWPMTHALYTGLNETAVEPIPRPSTSESVRTWYGNKRQSYASSISYSQFDSRSIQEPAQEPAARGEELGDLINRSQQVLSVLSFDVEKEAQRSQSRQSIAYSNGGAESSRAVTTRDDEPFSHHESGRHSQDHEAVQGSEGDVTSNGFTTVASSIRDISETPKRMSGTSTSGDGTPTVIPSSGSSNIATPQGRTATPSVSAGCDGMNEKKPDPVHVRPLISDDDISREESQAGTRDPEKNQPEQPTADDATETDDDRLTGLALASVTIALSAAVFLVAMDVNVIATAVPRITGEFRSLDDVGWYGSSFLMATCATQIPYGRIYSLFPAKWVFTSAIVVFMIGSLIAGLSPSSPILILGRSVQGLGTSGILSGGLIIMSQVVPLRIRPVLTSAIGAMEGVAMISAPIIGGVLTDRLHWRWCFYINLPIGGFALAVVLLCLRNIKDKVPRMQTDKLTVWEIMYKLDILGAITLLPPIVCVLLGLHFAGASGHSWADSDVILLFVLALVLFGIFGYIQHRNQEVAMLPFHVIKHRSVLAGFWFITCTSSALVVITYFLPLWFQTVQGTTASDSGVGILPMLVAVIVGILGSGALVSMIGYYTPFMLASSVLMPVGLGLLTTINPYTSRAKMLTFPAIFGLGVGMGFQQPLMGVQAALPQADIPAGTSVIVFGQAFGAAIIIAAGETLFQNRLLASLAKFMGITGVSSDALLGQGPESLSALVPTEKIPQLIETVNVAFTQTFFLAVALGALSVFGSMFMGWTSVKQPKSDESVLSPVITARASLRAAP
ncbi:hypothetical protein VTJ83DRAFT_4654 [Remersonia thermophila]|uniref:Major facilitator superfamily (MFS) profile domain-containing protein n=1 Tax=Remersonia thermophila TaxID=72144 RepID=A0ABR4DCR4_9PEZI